jgi:glucan phosphorylase
MNDGHAAFVPLELLNEPGSDLDVDAMRARCVFTTHTPVPAGHDRFDYGLVQRVFTDPVTLETIKMLAGGPAEHDAACAQRQPVRQRRRQAPRGGDTRDVRWL